MKKILLFIILYCCNQSLYSESLKTIIVNFARRLKENNSEEMVKGIIYYQAPKKIVLNVTEPLHQWMIFEDNILFIYYPKEQKAFQIYSKNPFMLSFFQAFVGIIISDFGLSEKGFFLIKSEKKGDTFITYWKPPKEKEKMLGNIIVGMIEEKLVFIEIQDVKGKKFIKTTYNNHFRYNNTFFPLEIISIKYEKKDSVVEKVIYENPRFDVPLPKEIVDFKIPNNIDVKRVEW